MDIFPTLLVIAGVGPPDSKDGISLYPNLLGKDQDTDNRIVYFMRREGGIYGGLCYYATRQDSYQLV